MAGRSPICIAGCNGNFSYRVPPFARLYEKLKLTLIPCGAQRYPSQYLGPHEAIAGLGVGEGGADQFGYGLDPEPVPKSPQPAHGIELPCSGPDDDITRSLLIGPNEVGDEGGIMLAIGIDGDDSPVSLLQEKPETGFQGRPLPFIGPVPQELDSGIKGDLSRCICRAVVHHHDCQPGALDPLDYPPEAARGIIGGDEDRYFSSARHLRLRNLRKSPSQRSEKRVRNLPTVGMGSSRERMS